MPEAVRPGEMHDHVRHHTEDRRCIDVAAKNVNLNCISAGIDAAASAGASRGDHMMAEIGQSRHNMPTHISTRASDKYF